jgi:hypothetical protein
MSRDYIKRIFVEDNVFIEDKNEFHAPTPVGKTRTMTPEGFLLCEDVRIARTGEQMYGARELLDQQTGKPVIEPGPDGVVIIGREPDEVFRDESIQSFEGKPVTVEHPNEFVSPENWKHVAVGTTHNVHRGEGADKDYLMADLLITDKGAIDHVNRDMPQISCGYDSTYDQTEVGHGIQRNIVGNHVALVDRGRAGPRCSIKDSAPLEVKDETVMDVLSEAFDGFDPDEPRDDTGKWTSGGGGKKSAEEIRKEAIAKAKTQKKSDLTEKDKRDIEEWHKRNPSPKFEGPQRHAGEAAEYEAQNKSLGQRMAEAKARQSEEASKFKSEKTTAGKSLGERMNEAIKAREKRTGERHKYASEKRGSSKDSISKLLLSIFTEDKTMAKVSIIDRLMGVLGAVKNKDQAALDKVLNEDEGDPLGETFGNMDAKFKDWMDACDKRFNDWMKSKDESPKGETTKGKETTGHDPDGSVKESRKEATGEEKKVKEAEDEILSAETLSQNPDMLGRVWVGDSVAPLVKDVIARAEILSPGISLPTADTAVSQKGVKQLILTSLSKARTTDAGKACIDPLLYGRKLETLDGRSLFGVFNAAAETMRAKNNSGARLTAVKTADFGKPSTVEDINKANAEFWAKGGKR